MLFFLLMYVGVIGIFVKHNFRKDDDSSDPKDIAETDDSIKNEYPSDISSSHLDAEAGHMTVEPEIVFFLILCEGTPKDKQGGMKASDISRQLRQAAVMLKSAVALTSSKLRFLVIADSEKLYNQFALIPSQWPEEYQQKIKLEYHDIWYPPDRVDMRNMFRVCATQRLFLPDMFPGLDAAIYIDTDLVFLRPPEDLWNEFTAFNHKQVAAMAPCLYHYGTKRNKVPFYGTSGLNAGIMHMNLTRMKEFPDGGWTPANMIVFDKYKSTIKLADQDILNILFNKYPQLLYELGCQWNYRLFQCSQGENVCPEAAKHGASILHGNALSFVSGQEMKLQVVFEAWENYVLGSPLKDLVMKISKDLEMVKRMGKPSKCARIPEIDFILTTALAAAAAPATVAAAPGAVATMPAAVGILK